MIDSAVTYIGDRLNAFLKAKDGGQVDRVIAGPLVSQDGSVPVDNHDKVVLSLVTVEQVRDGLSFSKRTAGSGAAPVSVSAPINLNLHLLVAASFSHYPTGLHYLSQAIAFLQANSSFDRKSRAFPTGLEKLVLTMANVEYSELSHLWNGLGAKYMPSALYLMRMITLDLEQIDGEIPLVTDRTVNLSP